MRFEDAERRLLAFPGVGIWTARSAMLRGMGFADAVPVGDYHMPHMVAFHLAGEPRADDTRMLELLEPYRGQRGRVVRWIERAAHLPPRRGPRMPLRDVPAEGRALARMLRPPT
jgi:3-methyladenine DNA glycosylase/8-oxoguanine DNA glycosylase